MNRRIHTKLLAFGIVCLSLFVSGCKKDKKGYYEGYLEVYQSQAEGQSLPVGQKWVAVHFEKKRGDRTILITDPKTGASIMEPILISTHLFHHFDPFKLRTINVSMPSLKTEFKLKMKRLGPTFRGSSTAGNYNATFYLKESQEIEIDITEKGNPVYHLTANPFSKPNFPLGQTPLTLQQAIDSALTINPASKAELQRKLRAKYISGQTAAELTPMFNASLMAPFATGPLVNPIAILYAAGHVAPFLSLNNWMDFGESRIDSKVAQLSYQIVRANLAAQVEGLVYAYRRDLLLDHQFSTSLEMAKQARNQMTLIESRGQKDHQPYITPESYKTAEALMEWIKTLQISNLLPSDRVALAQTMGIHDLDSVRNIKIGPELFPIEMAFDASGNPKKLNSDEVATEVARISRKYLELLQTKKAVEEAEVKKIQGIFSILDPIADFTTDFGLKTLWNGKLDQSNLDELREMERLIYDRLRQRALDAVQAYNDSLDGYKATLKALTVNQDRLNNILSPLFDFTDGTGQSGTIQSQFSVKSVFQDWLTNFMAVKSYHAAFRTARATLDRMLLRGYYHFLKSALPDAEAPLTNYPSGSIRTPDHAAFDDDVQDNSDFDTLEKKPICGVTTVPFEL